MPVPRRFDRRPPERDTTRINERIRVPKVRLIGADGEQLGIVEIDEALKRAQDADLDLVEVAPGSKPPVTRLLDYSKYKYEQEQKQKAGRKHQQQVNIREIKLRPKIANHDYETKKGHVERFLRHQDKVKITIMFRGREQAHPERGRALLQRLFEDLDGLAVIESEPLQEGRNMSMLLAPGKEAAVEAGDETPALRNRLTTSRLTTPLLESPPRQGFHLTFSKIVCQLAPRASAREKVQDVPPLPGWALNPKRCRRSARPRGRPRGAAARVLPGREARAAGIPAIAAGSRPSRVLVPARDRHRALGVVAQGEAGDAEVGGLLLDAAGVGEHRAGVGEQREEVEVAERLAEQQPRVVGLDRLHHLARARVDGEDDGHLARERGQPARPSRRAARRRRGRGGAG